MLKNIISYPLMLLFFFILFSCVDVLGAFISFCPFLSDILSIIISAIVSIYLMCKCLQLGLNYMHKFVSNKYIYCSSGIFALIILLGIKLRSFLYFKMPETTELNYLLFIVELIFGLVSFIIIINTSNSYYSDK